eukprot:TRINITY_DN25443_c0_g1_i1.p1 TRINITY_DN25443_c0_g1~~TRINITY_DN25443_c0_g1_i1.p1  ORF type:complete len:324 (+),score=60.59 TRINITY_DN25443_c0_g1_i1:54-1025(+)
MAVPVCAARALRSPCCSRRDVLGHLRELTPTTLTRLPGLRAQPAPRRLAAPGDLVPRGYLTASLPSLRQSPVSSTAALQRLSALRAVPVPRSLSAALDLCEGADKRQPSSSRRPSGDDEDPPKPEPDGNGARAWAFALDGVRFLDIATLPSRHLAWTLALCLFNLRFPHVYEHSGFASGVEQAIGIVYGALSRGKVEPLRGLVTDRLLSRLSKELDGAERQRWERPPVLLSARLLGVLWARTGSPSDDAIASDGPAVRVELAISLTEQYTYGGKNAAALNAKRLQRWIFERSLDADGSWMVVAIGNGNGPWYFQRRKEDDESE